MNQSTSLAPSLKRLAKTGPFISFCTAAVAALIGAGVFLQFFVFFLHALMTGLQSDILAATAAVVTLITVRSIFRCIYSGVRARFTD